jgi:ribosomal protein S18 acetylase RimI-like enzyme
MGNQKMSETIESGIIKRDKGLISEIEVDYELRFLDMSLFDEIVALQNIIYRSLPDQEIFKRSTADFIRDLFRVERSILGVLTIEGLVAYSMINFPGKSKENLGRDISLSDIELKKVAHLQAIVVHPSYRGNSLQARMAHHHLKIIRNNCYKHVCCTVSPKNPISLKNIMSCGFVIRGLKPKFGGYMRYILYKNFDYYLQNKSEKFVLMGNDITGQINLLNQGYQGFEMELIPNGFKVSYGYV